MKFLKRTMASVLTSLLFFAVYISAGNPKVEAAGTTYYVSPDGNNSNNGLSPASPWKTIKHACDQTVAGDTIRLMAGTFVETQHCQLKPGVNLIGNGSSGANKTVVTASWINNGGSHGWNAENYIISLRAGSSTNGNQVIKDIQFNGNNRKITGAIYTSNVNHITIHDLEILNFQFGGMWITNAGFIEMYNLYVKDSGWESAEYCSGNIMLTNLTDSSIHDSTIYAHAADSGYAIKGMPGGSNPYMTRCKFYNLVMDVKETALWGGGQAYNISMEFFDIWMEELQIYNNFTNQHMSFVGYNRIYNGTSYSLDVHDNDLILNKSYAIEFSNSKARYHNNYINCLQGEWLVAFSEYCTGKTITDVKIHHNIIENVLGICHIRANMSNVEIYNNVLVSNSWNGSIDPAVLHFYGSGTRNNYIIKNNILLFDKHPKQAKMVFKSSGAGNPANLVFTHNCYTNLLLDAPGTYSDNINGDPGLNLNGEKPYPFYSPANSSSPVVNAGTYVGFNVYDGQPDIGAYEYGESGATPTPAPTPTPTPTPTPINLIQNAGFENGTSGWYAVGCAMSASTAQKYNGFYSGLASSRLYNWGGLRQSITVSNGNTYIVSAWAKLASGSNTGKITAEIKVNGGPFQYRTLATGPINSTGWSQITGTYTFNESGVITVCNLYVETASGTTDLYIDDVFVVLQ